MGFSRQEWESRNKLDTVVAAHSRPLLLYVRTEILVHDYHPRVRAALERYLAGDFKAQTPDCAPCPCCANPSGENYTIITERRVDIEVLIDRQSGVRMRRDELPPPVWDRLCAVAEEVVIPIRVTREQLEILYVDTPNIFASGGNRSGKTTLGLYWIAREWLLRGAPKKRIWLVAPIQQDAFDLWIKLTRGDGKAPGIIPPELIAREPVTARSGDGTALLIDGTIVQLKNFKSPLKSHGIIAGLCDEASLLPSEDKYTALLNRTPSEKGRLYFATTPNNPSGDQANAPLVALLKEQIVEPCRRYPSLAEDDPARINHVATMWTFRQLSPFDNAWVDPIFFHRLVATLGGAESPSVRRDVFGEWISNSGKLWSVFDMDRHVLRNECRTLSQLAEWSGSDITSTVAGRLFGQVNPHNRTARASNLRYIGGMDVNRHPMSTVVLQVACDRSEPSNRDKWTVFVWDIVYTRHGNALKQADALKSHAFARVRDAAAPGSELAGIGIITDGTAVTRDPTAHSYSGDPRGLADLFGKAGFDVRPPEYSHNQRPVNPAKADSYRLVHRLFREGRLYIHERCQPLIEALLDQEDSGDGTTPVKVSHNRSDRLSSPVDAMRYALWPIFHKAEEKAPKIHWT